MPIDLRLFRLLQLASPTLPVGAFSWSQGLEAAVTQKIVSSAPDAQSWIGGLLRHGQCRLDIPVLVRMHRAWSHKNDLEAQMWNDRLYASRGSLEFQAEDREMGRALTRLLSNLGLLDDDRTLPEPPTFAALFALAAVQWDIDEKQTAAAFLWAFLENQVAAAVKLVPLGQSDGQKILMALSPEIPGLIESVLALSDSDIGAFTPAFAMLSSMHEIQHTRLFRS